MEGGLRVPAVVQWAGTLPAGESLGLWLSTVDLLPTMLEAGGLGRPANMKVREREKERVGVVSSQ